jgi:hypothetical protein
MKRNVLIAAFLSLSFLASAQSVTVVYNNKINHLPGSNDKVGVKVVEDEEVVGVDSITTRELGKKFSVILESTVITDGKTYKKSSTLKTFGANMGSSDSVTFRDGVWRLYNGAKFSVQSPQKYEFEKQEGTKNILGYECELYLGTHAATGTQLLFWVSKQFSPLVTPLPVAMAPGGVLEVRDLMGKWVTTAVELK